jgi:hypothetical protein
MMAGLPACFVSCGAIEWLLSDLTDAQTEIKGAEAVDTLRDVL